MTEGLPSLAERAYALATALPTGKASVVQKAFYVLGQTRLLEYASPGQKEIDDALVPRKWESARIRERCPYEVACGEWLGTVYKEVAESYDGVEHMIVTLADRIVGQSLQDADVRTLRRITEAPYELKPPASGMERWSRPRPVAEGVIPQPHAQDLRPSP